MIVSKVMPMKSAAGWYAGCCYVCNQDFPNSEDNPDIFNEQGDLVSGYPYSRESDYFESKEAAVAYIQSVYEPDEVTLNSSVQYC